MIKKLFLLFALFGNLSLLNAQTDTSAYQTQRLKVNALLAQRSAKFGQYDQSLDNRTGIFGFQTKSDVKNSNEILRQIVLNDNNIFKELKILMDYKDQEVRRIQNEASNNSSKIQNYTLSIKKLQDQNQILVKENSSLEKQKNIAYFIMVLLTLVLLVLIYFLVKKQKKQVLQH